MASAVYHHPESAPFVRTYVRNAYSQTVDVHRVQEVQTQKPKS